jgi:hypothetical protein
MNKIPVILIGLMACLAIGISTAQGQKYSLEDLGVRKGMEGSQPNALNFEGTRSRHRAQGKCDTRLLIRQLRNNGRCRRR